jgi:hypothetical protein
MRSPIPSVQLEGRRELSATGNGKSKLAADALRELIALAVKENNNDEADRLATKLILLQDATVKDRLSHMQFELMSKSLTTELSMKKLRDYAEKHPEDFEAIIQWFLSNKVDSTGTTTWIKNLPKKFRDQIMVQTGLLQFYLNIADFKEVFYILRSRHESLNLPPRVLDLAERAIKNVDDDLSGASRDWMDALFAADGNPQALYYLSLLASAKGWSSATGLALSALADNAPNQPGVWNLLARHESMAGNLPGYYKALCGLMKINPYDIHVASDWVIASVLLRKGDKAEILDVAKRTYNATEPADPWAGTAYAMALLSDKRPQQALEIMNRMSEVNRMLPQRAVYVGAVLAASGHKEQALMFFERSESFNDNNFPEELALRRIWEGVARGEATTEDEEKRILALKKEIDPEQIKKLRIEMQQQLDKRQNREETMNILRDLQSVTEKRRQQGVPEDVKKLLRDVPLRSGKPTTTLPTLPPDSGPTPAATP